jgi:hypothetical protein
MKREELDSRDYIVEIFSWQFDLNSVKEGGKIEERNIEEIP